MTVFAERRFTTADQQLFAQLSGDWNPMHVDRTRARRYLLGDLVVHGMHGVLWALDAGIEFIDSACLTSVEAKFHKGILVGESVELLADDVEQGGGLRLVVDGQTRVNITVAWHPCGSRDQRSLPPGPDSAREPSCLDIEDITVKSGKLPLFLDHELSAGLFPVITRKLPPAQIAQIAGTSRLVGMEVPGLNSIYNSLKLRFPSEDEATGGEMLYQVRKAYPRFRRVSLRVHGAGLEGVIEASYRPEPTQQGSWETACSHVSGAPFAGQRALVVGGSRGLGEATTKLLAAGGAHVLATYNEGESDARRVVEEIGRRGDHGMARVSVGRELDVPSVVTEFGPTHVYFFATPHIATGRRDQFSPEQFSRFCNVYLHGFHELVLHLLGSVSDGLQVLYPSSVYVQSPTPDLQEYSVAKAAGEAICRSLMVAHRGLCIFIPRLPALTTDQTAGLVSGGAGDPMPVMASVLHAFGQGARGIDESHIEETTKWSDASLS